MTPGRRWKAERKEDWANAQPWQKSLKTCKPRIIETFDMEIPSLLSKSVVLYVFSPYSIKSVVMFVASASTKVTPSVSTPAALTEITVGEFIICDAFEGFPGIDAVETTNVIPEDQQYHFEPNAFDIMHQMHNDYNKAGLYQQLSLPEGQIEENFEFTDFIPDCF